MRNIFLILSILTVLTVYSCATPHYATQTVREVRADTVYMTQKQYDSVYIYKDRSSDYKRGDVGMPIDTLYVREVSVEYRYRMLHDTVRVACHDSIPYEVTVTETREITRPLTWFDHISRACFGFVVLVALLGIVRLVRKVKRIFSS